MTQALRYMDSKGVYSAEFEADALIAASIALEVAVDEYTKSAFVVDGLSISESAKIATLVARREDVVRAATQVALAMADADIDGGSLAMKDVIAIGLAEQAARAETIALAEARRRREAFEAELRINRRTEGRCIRCGRPAGREECAICTVSYAPYPA